MGLKRMSPDEVFKSGGIVLYWPAAFRRTPHQALVPCSTFPLRPHGPVLHGTLTSPQTL